MINKSTDFFQITDNFIRIKHILSLPLKESRISKVPKVTIAIPTYKRAVLLKEAIESAINQNEYSDYEIIVVDNDPVRNCETEILMHDFQKTPNLGYYKNTANIGMAGNWNRCFELSRGEYVVLLHDDDILFPDFLKEGMKFIDNKKDIGILKPRNYRLDGRISKPYFSDIPILNGEIHRLYDMSFYYGQVMGVPSGIFFNRDNVLTLGGFNQDFFPTSDFCFTVLFSRYFKVYILNKYLSFYRIDKNESINLETLKGFIMNDYYFLSQLLSIHKIPHFIVDGFLRHRTKNNSIANKNLWNKNFNFDISLLNIKEINPLLGKFYHAIVRYYMYNYVFFKKLKNIFKNQ